MNFCGSNAVEVAARGSRQQLTVASVSGEEDL